MAGAIGCDVRTVIRWIMHNGGLRSYERKRSPRNLSLAEREEIAVGIARGTSGVVIGASFGPGVFDDHSGDITQRWPPAVSGLGGGPASSRSGSSSQATEAGALRAASTRGGGAARAAVVSRADLSSAGLGLSRRRGDEDLT